VGGSSELEGFEAGDGLGGLEGWVG
jgi:hypothetical protein